MDWAVSMQLASPPNLLRDKIIFSFSVILHGKVKIFDIFLTALHDAYPGYPGVNTCVYVKFMTVPILRKV